MTGWDVLWVGLAGSVGAGARYLIDAAAGPQRRPILLVNVTGSLVAGILTGLVVFHGAPANLAVVAVTGFCGGYTTFSTTSADTAVLLRARRYRSATAEAVVTLAGCLAAAAIGLASASAGP